MKHQAFVDALKALPMDERIEVAEVVGLALECCSGCGCPVSADSCEHDQSGPGPKCACPDNPRIDAKIATAP